MGYPGGWGTPKKSLATASSPESSRVTVGARVNVYTARVARKTTQNAIQSSLRNRGAESPPPSGTARAGGRERGKADAFKRLMARVYTARAARPQTEFAQNGQSLGGGEPLGGIRPYVCQCLAKIRRFCQYLAKPFAAREIDFANVWQNGPDFANVWQNGFRARRFSLAPAGGTRVRWRA